MRNSPSMGDRLAQAALREHHRIVDTMLESNPDCARQLFAQVLLASGWNSHHTSYELAWVLEAKGERA